MFKTGGNGRNEEMMGRMLRRELSPREAVEELMG
jgi:hypothetical protein